MHFYGIFLLKWPKFYSAQICAAIRAAQYLCAELRSNDAQDVNSAVIHAQNIFRHRKYAQKYKIKLF